LAAAFALCVFNLFIVGLFAQEGFELDETAPVEVPAINPHTAAEQALFLENNPAETAVTSRAASALSILRVLLTLAVVAAAIYGLIFLVKRLSRGSTVRDPFLKVLASVPLGANRSAHIISVGAQAWLVGVAENGVNLISEVGDKDILNAMFLEDSRRIAAAQTGGITGGLAGGRFPDFKALLRRLGMPVDSAPPGPESIRKRGERLKGL